VTDDEAKALGLRAVVCPGWRLVPGVVDCDGVRVLRVGEHTIDAFDPRANGIGGQVVMRAERLGPPDFRDPATLGCLLELVREVWDDPWLHVENWEDGWTAMGQTEAMSGALTAMCHTEAEALVAAMEAAPARVSP
jgi:hypothetical protein